MNFFKKIIAKLTNMEVSVVPRDPMDDPRTRILTRGPARVESSKEKFERQEREASELSRERKEIRTQEGYNTENQGR